MATVTLPAGTVPVRSLTTSEILAGDRVTTFRYDLLDSEEQLLGTLDGVEGGHLEWRASAAVKGSGKLDVRDRGQQVDWLTARVRPVISINGLDDEYLGVFLATEAPEDWSDTGRLWTVGLLDKLTIPEQDKVDTTYTVDAGDTITDEVVTLIESTGETNIAITPSAKTLVNPLVWPVGTSKLQIINDLLDVAGYFALHCDGAGQYRAEPYTRPAARPVAWEFLDDEDSGIYLPDFTRDRDIYSIPNKVVAVTRGSGDTEAITGSATNEDETSPYSIDRRGRTITHTETDVEAADQTTLTAYARRRLIELTSPTATVEVRHPWVPGHAVNNVVRLRRVPAGIDARHAVTTLRLPLDGTALATSSLREVVDL